MAATPGSRNNPYVGPHAFTSGQHLYGRDRERAEILDLLIAGRVALLHSPSGAGKSSLIQAALIPDLQEEGFNVLPSMRVNLLPPVDQIDPAAIKNRYIFSLLLSMEEDKGLPADRRVALPKLATLTLTEYLEQRPKTATRRHADVLIFDQFEELLTLNPATTEEKEECFKQIGAALDTQHRWALFAMREDYLGPLEPYLHWLPSHLTTRFRLDFLDRDNARAAITGPAAAGGIPFADDAADQLVDDLRRVQVQQLDGSIGQELGSYVEPVQLQVVCYRLWERLPAGAAQILGDNIAKVGDVDQALEEYYADCVADIARRNGVSEELIRRWIERQLIFEHKTRGQVFHSRQRSAGLENAIIDDLIEAYVVRREINRGITWYELAHDRLIDPILKNNVGWFEQHPTPLQQSARLWDQNNRQDSFLLRGAALAKAQEWAESRRDELTPLDAEFLAASRKAQMLAEQERIRNRQLRRLAIAATAVSIVVLVALGVAFYFYQRASEQEQAAVAAKGSAVVEAQHAAEAQQTAQANAIRAVSAQTIAEAERQRAEEQARISHADLLALQAQEALARYPQRSLLLSVAAISTTLAQKEPPRPSASSALWNALAATGGRGLAGQAPGSHTSAAVTALAFSEDNRWLATGSADGTIHLWDIRSPTLAGRALRVDDAQINAIAISPDGRWLIAGGVDKIVRLWDLRTASTRPSFELTGHTDRITGVAVSSDSRWLVTIGEDPDARRWDLTAADPSATATVLKGDSQGILAVAISPDNRWIVTGGRDHTARRWDLTAADPSAGAVVFQGHTDAIKTLAISADSRWLATGGLDRAVWLWALNDPNSSDGVQLSGHTDQVTAVAIGPDSRTIVTGSLDQTIRRWQMPPSLPATAALTPSSVLSATVGPITSLAITPDGRQLIVGGFQPNPRLFDFTNLSSSSPGSALPGHEGGINALVVSRDGRWLATGSVDGTARLWDLTASQQIAAPTILSDHTAGVDDLAISPDGHWLVSGSANGELRRWDLTRANPASGATALPGHTAAIRAIAISPDGRWLVSGDEAGDIRRWSLADPRIANGATSLRGHTAAVNHLAISPDDTWLASGGSDATVRLWKLGSTAPASSTIVLEGHQFPITDIAISPDGRWLVTASEDGAVRRWDLKAVNPATSGIVVAKRAQIVNAIAISPDSRWLATAGEDGSVQRWDLAASSPESTGALLLERATGITAVAFSPDGRWLAAAGSDGVLWRWDLNAPGDARPVILGAHGSGRAERPISTIAISHNSQWLVSAGVDGIARIWRLSEPVPSGNPVVLPAHTQALFAVALSRDDHMLATGSADKTIRLWDLRIGALVDLACRAVGRNLTDDEWQQYFGGRSYQAICPE